MDSAIILDDTLAPGNAVSLSTGNINKRTFGAYQQNLLQYGSIVETAYSSSDSNHNERYPQSQLAESRLLPPLDTGTSLVGEILTQNVRSSTAQRTKNKRKLDLTKCDRCRFDKQKCTPEIRAWPASKCDRCMKKGFPCSEPSRVERPSKFAALYTQPPASSYDEHASDDLVEKWTFLTGYQQILRTALDRLNNLEQDILQTFDMNIAHVPRREPDSQEEKIRYIIKHLESTLSTIKEKVSIAPLLSKKARMSLFVAMENPVSSASLWHSSCPFCHPSTYRIADDYKMQDLKCHEFSLRVRRLPVHGESRCKIDHQAEILTELRELYSMAISITDKMAEILAVDGQERDFTNLCLPIGILFPDGLIGEFLYDGNRCYDLNYLNRTAAHRWLDGITRNVASKPYLSGLLHAVEANSFNPDQQDFLGRTLLMIACQMAWPIGVSFSLTMGANPNLSTVYGSLPLHYAAVNGSMEICQLLLAHEAKFDVFHKDEEGWSAWDYADEWEHEAVADMLAMYRKHNDSDEIGGESGPNEDSSEALAVAANHDSESLLLQN